MKQKMKNEVCKKTYVNNTLNRNFKRATKKISTTRKTLLRTEIINEYKLKLRSAKKVITPSNPSKPVIRKVIDRRKKHLQKVKTRLHKSSKKIEIIQPQQIIAFHELKLDKKIGNGGFGDVHIAKWKGQKVAVKKLRLLRVPRWKKKQFEDEVRNHATLDHPNIVKFLGACMVTPNLALVMEYLPDGSLHDNLYTLKIKFKEKVKNQFICDCLSALKYIHSMDMIHRDIKCRNVMLYDKKRRCKLIDFDLVLKKESKNKCYDFAGTEKYCPKELLEGKKLTIEELKSADVYSMALTIYELLTEKEPFAGYRNIHRIQEAIRNDEILKSLERKECGISKTKKDLLKLALSLPQNRPSAVVFFDQFNRILPKS